MASKPLHNAMRNVGRNALDLPVAALAGLAVAFLAFAMPSDLMTQLVTGSGLPSLLPAAEPPLGMKARAGVGLIGAVVMFVLVFALLRLLDRTGLDNPKNRPVSAQEVATPRPRKRDAHPDAPAPRPISAAREFGEPTPPVPPKHAVPDWLDDQDVVVSFVDGEPTPAVCEIEPAPQPEAIVAPEPAPAPEPVIAPEPVPPPVSVAEEPASLDELMARLEQGLRQRRAPAQAGPTPASMPQVFPEPGEDRLQSAIHSLQRLAERQR